MVYLYYLCLHVLGQLPLANSQNPNSDSNGPNQSADTSDADDLAEMMRQQAILNHRIATSNYHIMGLGVILAMFVGIIMMIHRGNSAFRSGWFLYGKVPENKELKPPPAPTRSPSTQARLGVLRQIYNLTFLQNVPLVSKLTICQVALSSFFVALVLILAILFNPDPSLNPRRYGYLAGVNIPFMVLFSMKNSPLALLGKGYEKFNYLHRLLGYIVIICIFIHGGLMIRFASQGMISNKNALYSGCFLGVVILLVGITALRPMRKKFYKLFYFVHVVGYISIFAGCIYHERTLRPYIFSAVCLHLLSSGWQVLKWEKLNATLTPLPGKITRIEIHGLATGWKAGHHVRLRVLGDFWLGMQAHPFTIASAASQPGQETNSLILYVKAVGSFTTMLYAKAVTVDGFQDVRPVSQNRLSNGSRSHVRLPSDLCASRKVQEERKSIPSRPESTAVSSVADEKLSISQASPFDLGFPDGVQLDVHVEGPYGGVGWRGFDEFKEVIVCAGGSGISFLVGVLSELLSLARHGGATKRALVIYVVREWEVAEYFGKLIMQHMEESKSFGLSLDVRFFVTKKVENAKPLGDIKLRWHRPQLDVLVKEFLMDVTDGQGVSLGACGPPGLMAQVKSSVAVVDFKKAHQVGGIHVHIAEQGW